MIAEIINKIDLAFNQAIWVQPFVWTLIHSIWQCAIISTIVFLIYKFFKKPQSSTLYLICTFGYFCCPLLSLITFIQLMPTPKKELVYTLTNDSPAYLTLIYRLPTQSSNNFFDNNAKLLFFIWLITFLYLAFKYLKDHLYSFLLTRNSYSQFNAEWTNAAKTLCKKIHLKPTIDIRTSNKIQHPCALGFFKKIVILPLGILTQLSREQIELILLHELAHIKRYDYLANSLQLITKNIYFFNPFIHWLYSKLDEERENACDDIVVNTSNESLAYAKTLTEFVEMNNQLKSSTAFIGSKNLLSNRIKRLFESNKISDKSRNNAVSGVILVVLSCTIALLSCSMVKNGDNQLHRKTLQQFKDEANNRCQKEFDDLTFKNPMTLLQIDSSKLSCQELHDTLAEADKTISNRWFSLEEIKNIGLTKCPNEMQNVNLKNPDRTTAFIFRDYDCSTFKEALTKIDSFETPNKFLLHQSSELKMEKVRLSELFEQAKKQCPNETQNLTPKQPDAVIAIDVKEMSCAGLKLLLESINKANIDVAKSNSTSFNISSRQSKFDEIAKLIRKQIAFSPDAMPNYSNFYSVCQIKLNFSNEGKAKNFQYSCQSSDPISDAQVQVKLSHSIETTDFSEYLKTYPDNKSVEFSMLFGSSEGIDKNFDKIKPYLND